MKIPLVYHISYEEFEKAEGVSKIIVHDVIHKQIYFELNRKKYYVGYFSPAIEVDFMILENEKYILLGVDLKVVVLCCKTGSILLSLGLFSFFKGFENTNSLTFTIFTELEDIVINKNGLSVSQIISHPLEF